MAANDDPAPYARRAADLLRIHLQDAVILIPPPSTREQNEAIDAIARSLRRRRHYALGRGVGAFAALVIAASAVAVLFSR